MKMKIIDILNIIAKGGIPPKEIRYNMLLDGYKDLIYDEEEMEYRYKKCPMEFLEVPNHHLNDEVEIIKE